MALKTFQQVLITDRFLCWQKQRAAELEAVTRGVPLKKAFLKNLQNSQENTCVRVSFLKKLQTQPATLLKKNIKHRCFPVNLISLFYRTPPAAASTESVFEFFHRSLKMVL